MNVICGERVMPFKRTHVYYSLNPPSAAEWQCMDSLHFVYIHCDTATPLNRHKYAPNWGGIVFAHAEYEASATDGLANCKCFPLSQNALLPFAASSSMTSQMEHVEIVGAGE
jgi:hypothetical protein